MNLTDDQKKNLATLAMSLSKSLATRGIIGPKANALIRSTLKACIQVYGWDKSQLKTISDARYFKEKLKRKLKL